MSLIITISFLLCFCSTNAMIIGECNQPNTWKTWLNVHRPTGIGFSLSLK